MITTTRINLANIPAPDVIEEIDYESIVDELKQMLNAEVPLLFDKDGKPQILKATLVELPTGEKVWQIPQSESAGLLYLHLESDTTTRQITIFAYREMILRSRINDAARATMLHYSHGADLDNLAVFHKLERLVITPEDNLANPVVPAVMESDADFLRRILLSPDRYTTAGSEDSYLFHALTADGKVKDTSYNSPNPTESDVYVLSHEGNGEPDATLLATVESALNDKYVRPNSELVRVHPATIVNYSVDATLTVYPGIDSQAVLDAAQDKLNVFIDENHKLGRDITESGLHAALHVEGVMSVALAEPNALPIVNDESQAPYCTAVNVVIGGIDE